MELLSRQIPSRLIRDNCAAGISQVYQVFREHFVVEPCPYREDAFRPIQLDFGAYADAGFFAEAIASKVSSRNPEAMDKSVLSEVATLCQKAGYVDMAWRFIYEGLLYGVATTPQVKAHTYLLALKLHSQQADESGAK